MQTLHKSKYYDILFDGNKSLIVHKAFLATSEMSDNEFKNEMLIFAEMCEKYLPDKDLVDLIDMRYLITPEIQEWLDVEIFPRFLVTIKRIALLMPTEMIVTLGVEQAMDEKVAKTLTQAYFDDENKAVEWLMKQD